MSQTSCCYLCTECPQSFQTLESLEEHLGMHSAHKMMIDVEMVDHHSPSSSELSDGPHSHEGTLHSQEESPSEQDPNDLEDSMMDLKPGYNCRFCPTSFENQSQLNIHYTHTHRDKPQYECDTCHTVFAVKRELSTHMRIHSGETPHKCTQCGKEFGTRQLLKKHWMWHTGERTHVCKHCNKAFFQKGHLTQHLMIHSGGRPHQCQLCQKTFIFKFDLNRHMKIHAERGFSCNQCGRSFQRQVSLDEHSLKCKGRSPPISMSPPSGVTPVSMLGNSMGHGGAMPPLSAPTPMTPFPMMQQGLMGFNQENIAKLAQMMAQQQQQRAALSALLSAAASAQTPPMSMAQQSYAPPPPAIAPSPATSFCVLCSKHFPSQQLFALHMFTAHVHGAQQMSMQTEIQEKMVEQPLSLAPSVFHPVHPIKTEHEELINVNNEEATDSSCASSPQKPSPVSGTLSPSVGSHHNAVVSSASSMTSSDMFQSSMPCSRKDSLCDGCDSHKHRTTELEDALRAKENELVKYKEMMRTVVSTAHTLLGQCSSDNMFIAHTKNMFQQLQSTLLTSE